MNIGILLVKCGGDAEFGSEERVILKRNGVATEYNYVRDKRVKDIALKPGDFIEIPKGRGFFGKK